MPRTPPRIDEGGGKVWVRRLPFEPAGPPFPAACACPPPSLTGFTSTFGPLGSVREVPPVGHFQSATHTATLRATRHRPTDGCSIPGGRSSPPAPCPSAPLPLRDVPRASPLLLTLLPPTAPCGGWGIRGSKNQQEGPERNPPPGRRAGSLSASEGSLGAGMDLTGLPLGRSSEDPLRP